MKLKINLTLIVGIGLLSLASCQSPEEQIVKKWQVVSMENKHDDSMAQDYLKSIDTITSVDTMLAMNFGSFDLDTIKSRMKESVNADMEQRKESAKLLSLDFRKDGVVVFGNAGRMDSIKYEIVDKKKLVFIPFPDQPEGKPDTVFLIESISGSSLKFKMAEAPYDVFLNLRPFTKDDSIAAVKATEKMDAERQEQMEQMQQMQQMQQDAAPTQ